VPLHRALCPGSFDPVTHGHLDIVERAAGLFDEVVVAVGVNASENRLFSADERIAMLQAEVKPIAAKTGTAIDIITFGGLAVEAAREIGAGVIVRGLRDAADFDYEMQMAGMNGAMAPDIETVFVAATPGVRHIAASLVRQIAVMGGDASAFVSPAVAKRLKSKAKH